MDIFRKYISNYKYLGDGFCVCERGEEVKGFGSCRRRKCGSSRKVYK
jgi:hypothetical protein